MSDTSAGLQFESAEFQGAAASTACASCAAPIRSTYYQIGSAITCERCRRQLEFDDAHGSAVLRFLKAGLLGGLGAAVGAGLYYGVRALTGYEFGLIAVVVGFLVGGGVRMGSGGRGGIPYQLLAVALTYTSIIATYIPYVLEGYQKQVAAEPSGVVVRMILLVVMIAIAFAAPFLAGFENIIGIVIIGIGLYEAWKINRKPDRTVTGPFRIEATPAPAPALEPAAP